jgi:nucleotide-binding universal stress UspA family protein
MTVSVKQTSTARSHEELEAEHDELVHSAPSEDDSTERRVITIALDHSDCSRHAFNWAITNVIRPQTDLVILTHCRPTPTIHGPHNSIYIDFTEYMTRIDQEYRNESHSMLRQFAAILKKHNIPVEAIAMRGDPRTTLVRKAKELDSDLLVLGSRGLGAFKRTLLGSVSDYCAHHCHCPVVIVKQKDS